MKLSFFVPPELYSIVMKMSPFVMSSQDEKLSSWALLLAAAELAAVVVATTQVVAIVMAATKVIVIVVVATKVDALVLVVNEFVAVAVMSLDVWMVSTPCKLILLGVGVLHVLEKRGEK
jgi:hypothetical protein